MTHTAPAEDHETKAKPIDSHDLSRVLEILKSISAKRDASEVLYTFTKQIADNLSVDRCSVVRIHSDQSEGRVLASHEDPAVTDLALDLTKYPELAAALERKAPIVINDLRHDELTARFEKELAQSGITALVVVPVILFDERLGSFLLRAARRTGTFTEREVHFCELVAESAANALERAYLLEDLRKANEELQELARIDGLTGLLNHRSFRERLDEEISRAERYGTPLACMFVDVDDFKVVNDRYGHLTGDEVLQEIAKRTQQRTRRNDIVARYGGEEFVILLPQTDREGAITQGRRLLETIAEAPYPGLPTDDRVTVSIGMALFDDDVVNDGETLLAEADAALYKAKQRGKNRLVLGNEEYGA